MDMHKEMPEWLKKNYNTLWGRHKNEAFTFNNVEEELNISREMTIKTLWELEQRGFVNKERSEIDYRARTYRLISPEDINFVIGLYSLMEKEKLKKQTLMDKLVFIGDELPYVITGSHAAYHYHHYINPPTVVEIKINLQDEGKWIAFLTDDRTSVFIGDVIETKKINNYVKLLHSTRAIDTIRTKTKRGYYVEKPEFIIIELLERQTQNSITEAMAIIISNKTRIIWTGRNDLLHLAKSWRVSRQLGFLLDAMNLEACRPVIKPTIIETIKKSVTGKDRGVFPNDVTFLSKFYGLRNKLAHQALLTKEEKEEVKKAMERFEGYKELSKKWGIQVILPREVIRKVLDDFGVKIGKR